MFTKEDLYIHEVYNPPAGEKEIFILPHIFGGKDYYSIFRVFRCRASKTRDGWEVKTPGYLNWFSISDRMSVYTVLRFINNPIKSSKLYRDLIHHCFGGNDL